MGMGDNLLKKSENMGWWDGVTVKDAAGGDCKVTTLVDALNDMVAPPKRDLDKPMRLPISGVYKIKGVGDVLAGRVEQGKVENNKDVIFLPTHTTGVPYQGKVFTVEMRHKRVDFA